MDKKQELLNEAMQLFSSKGFHQTSVQEIAASAGISKGAFYKHFHSKEQLFIEILKSCQSEISRILLHPEFIEGFSKKENFVHMLEIQIRKTLANKEFFIMAFMDHPKELMKETEELMHDMRETQKMFYRENLAAIYGPRIQPFLADLVVLFEGMLNGYIGHLILEDYSLDSKRLAASLVEYIEAVVARLDSLEPLLQPVAGEFSKSAQLFDVLEMRLSHAGFSENTKQSVSLLKEEAEQSQPRIFLLEALFTYLHQEDRLQPELGQLENIILKGV